MCDIYLISVPNRNIDYPALALPTLTSRLRADGFNVIQSDINILIKDRMITAKCLNALKNYVLPTLIARTIFNVNIMTYFVKLNNYLRVVEKTWGFDTIERIKILMQERKYDTILEDKEGFGAALAIFKINRLLHNYVEYYTFHDLEIQNLFSCCGIEDPIATVVEETIQDIVNKKPLILGLTVLEIQRNFALYFVRKIKMKYHGKIVFGGADPTRYKDNYLKWFDVIDFVLVKEGEDSLPQLLSALKKDLVDYSSINGIIYRNRGNIVFNPPVPISVCRIPHPDFDGIRLDKYLTSTLPVHASRACYWALENVDKNPEFSNKRGCKFCAHYKTYSDYYERDAKSVVDDMEMLHKLYGTNLFHLTDDALKPSLGLAISKEIQKRQLYNFKWLVYARFEDAFTKEVLEEWHKGGVRVIEWGMESASQKVINLMNKAIKVETAQRIVSESKDIGILNKLFMFHNFPGETVEDLQESLDFLYRNTLNETIRPFPTIRNKMYLLKDTALYNSVDKERLYEKVWKPSGDFDVTALYVDLNDYAFKLPMLEEHLSIIKKLARDRFVFSTDDENVMFDLVVSDLKEQGKHTYYCSI